MSRNLDSLIKPKVSVIIPIYNVEKYIEQCARSLFEQTLDRIEYIYVDDCSPDKSVEILERIIEIYRPRFAREYKTVRIERMPTNRGQASVRRHGIQLCNGEYIVHCDSDDWIEPDAYEKCYKVAKESNADIVFFDFWRDYTGKLEHIHRNIPKSKMEILDGIISGSIMGSVCGAFIHGNLYKNIKFYPQKNLWEDFVLMVQIVSGAKSIRYIPDALYHYRVVPDSITSKGTKEKAENNFLSAYENSNLVFEFLNERNEIDKFKESIVARKNRVLYILAPFTNYEYVYKLWRDTYDNFGKQVISCRKVSFIEKLIWLFVRLHIFHFMQNIIHIK